MDTCMKALYIIINAGFSEEAVLMARDCGARGATIINARGSSAVQKTIMGITVDSEKEIILSIVDCQTADKIIEAINAKIGVNTPANGICFTTPVEMAIGINSDSMPDIK